MTADEGLAEVPQPNLRRPRWVPGFVHRASVSNLGRDDRREPDAVDVVDVVLAFGAVGFTAWVASGLLRRRR